MVHVKLGKQGRLVIPAELRRLVGIEGEDDLVAWVEDGKLLLQRRSTFEEGLWAELEGAPWTVDGFIGERRSDAEREWAAATEVEARSSSRS